MIHFNEFNESHLKISCVDFGIDQELSDFFCFFMDGYRFTPKYKEGIWDGKIRLYDLRTKTLPKGLLKVAIRFCKDRDYPFTIDPSLNPKTYIKREDVEAFINSVEITSGGKHISIRDYQIDAIVKSFETYRNILVSPTSSGKSLILYMKIRYHIDVLGHNVLLIVPSTQLVEQMLSDFIDYSSVNNWDVEGNAQILYAGKEKAFTKRLMISTWQSIHAMMKNNPAQFKSIVEKTDVACFDEAHGYKADAVLSTMSKFIFTKWRTGTTGTLDDKKLNQLQLTGLIGEPYQVITTKELMDAGAITKLDTKVIILDYPDHVKKEMKGMDYKAEINYLVGNSQRNHFIKDIALKCKGNTLILFSFVGKHGNVLNEIITAEAGDKPVYYVHGGVDVKDREDIRKIINTENNAILIANSKLFSTGTNIPAIENIIFAMPTKSTIRVRQSIGRGLRLKSGKTRCYLFDIADDLSTGKYRNHTLNHLTERLAIYDKEQFDYEVNKVKLPE